MKTTLRWIVIAAVVFPGGCIESPEYGSPPKHWSGAKESITFPPATEPTTAPARNADSVVGTVEGTPGQAVKAVRQLLEPAFGPMRIQTITIKVGQDFSVLQTPRFAESFAGLDYDWIEVEVTVDPAIRKTALTIDRKQRRFYFCAFTKHAILPFPFSVVSVMQTQDEQQLLRALTIRLKDLAR